MCLRQQLVNSNISKSYGMIHKNRAKYIRHFTATNCLFTYSYTLLCTVHHTCSIQQQNHTKRLVQKLGLTHKHTQLILWCNHIAQCSGWLELFCLGRTGLEVRKYLFSCLHVLIVFGLYELINVKYIAYKLNLIHWIKWVFWIFIYIWPNSDVIQVCVKGHTKKCQVQQYTFQTSYE